MRFVSRDPPEFSSAAQCKSLSLLAAGCTCACMRARPGGIWRRLPAAQSRRESALRHRCRKFGIVPRATARAWSERPAIRGEMLSSTFCLPHTDTQKSILKWTVERSSGLNQSRPNRARLGAKTSGPANSAPSARHLHGRWSGAPSWSPPQHCHALGWSGSAARFANDFGGALARASDRGRSAAALGCRFSRWMAAAKRSSPDAGSEPANRIAEDQSRRASGCPRARPTPLSLANSRAGKNAEPGAAAAFRSIEFVNEQQWRASINSTFGFLEWAVQTFKSYRHAQDFTPLRIVMAGQLACSQRFCRLIG